jgi:hypothetical protein
MNRHIVLWVISVIGCLIYVWIYLQKKNTVNEVDSQNQLVVQNSSYCNCTRKFTGQSSDGRESWCSEEATMRGPGQNVVVYSLYGDAVTDNETTTYYLLLNTIPLEVEQFYPGKYWRPDYSNLNYVQFHTDFLRFCPNRMVDTSVSQYKT